MLVVTSPWQPHAATYSASLLLHVCLLGDEGGNTHTHTQVYTDTHTRVRALIGPHTCEHPGHACTQERIYPQMHAQVHTRVDTHDHTHAQIHTCVHRGVHVLAHRITHVHTCARTHRDTQTIESGEERKGPGVDESRTTGSWLCCSEPPHYSGDGPSASPAFVRHQPARPGEVCFVMKNMRLQTG